MAWWLCHDLRMALYDHLQRLSLSFYESRQTGEIQSRVMNDTENTETEAEIQAALAELMKGRTSVVIAHRLSTVKGADEILVVDEGRIIEKGRHSDLIKGGGLYRKLYDRQFGGAAA